MKITNILLVVNYIYCNLERDNDNVLKFHMNKNHLEMMHNNNAYELCPRS